MGGNLRANDGEKTMRAIRGLALGLGLLPAAALAMEIETDVLDLRPVNDPLLRVEMTGEILPGDTRKLEAALGQYAPGQFREILFLMDSPGGEVFEGLEIGRIIAARPEITSVQVGTKERPDAICASACVYTYLGADYRNLAERGRLGVHRFSAPGMELDGHEALSDAQEISGLILSYITDMRADPQLFRAMTDTAAEDIHWLRREDLEEWRVVNGNVYDELAEYVNIEGKVRLMLQQISRFGDSRMLLTCPDNRVLALVNLAEPELTMLGTMDLVIDGEGIEIDEWHVLDRENGRLRAVFMIPPHLTGRVAAAKTIGARAVLPSNEMFFGFEQTIRDEKLRDMVGGCVGQASFDLPPMLVLDETDLPGRDLSQSGFRDISFRQCQQLCIAEPGCEAVSYVTAKRWCWPKGAGASPRPAPGVISALRSGG